MPKKLVVIGLDGATWKLLKPLMDEGVMPNLKRIVEGGVQRRLESTMPAMTGPSWATFATGVNPGKHGVFDFMLPNDSLSNLRVANSKEILVPTIYEMMDKANLTPILVNLPCTWPPRLKNHITVTSLLTQGDQWIYPTSLKEEFAGFASYRLTPNEKLRAKEDDSRYLDDMLLHLDQQMACVKWLWDNKPWDFFYYLFSHSDWASHAAFTQLMDSREPSALRVFKKIDEYLAWFLEKLPSEANLIMVSDHGFKDYRKVFYFNRWLAKEGFLATKEGGEGFKETVTRRSKEMEKVQAKKKKIRLGSSVFNWLEKIPVLESAAKWTYHHIVKPYLPLNIKVDIGIDFPNTAACFPKGSYLTSVYLNDARKYQDGKIKTEEDYQKTLNNLIDKVSAVRGPDGKPIVTKIFTKEAVYGDAAPLTSPDLFFELGDYWLDGHFYTGKLFDDVVNNKHDQWGIFAAYGPDMAKGLNLPDARMCDITPTLLHMLNLPVFSYFDGKPLKDIFGPASDFWIREPKVAQKTLAEAQAETKSFLASTFTEKTKPVNTEKDRIRAVLQGLKK